MAIQETLLEPHFALKKSDSEIAVTIGIVDTPSTTILAPGMYHLSTALLRYSLTVTDKGTGVIRRIFNKGELDERQATIDNELHMFPDDQAVIPEVEILAQEGALYILEDLDPETGELITTAEYRYVNE